MSRTQEHRTKDGRPFSTQAPTRNVRSYVLPAPRSEARLRDDRAHGRPRRLLAVRGKK